MLYSEKIISTFIFAIFFVINPASAQVINFNWGDNALDVYNKVYETKSNTLKNYNYGTFSAKSSGRILRGPSDLHYNSALSSEFSKIEHDSYFIKYRDVSGFESRVVYLAKNEKIVGCGVILDDVFENIDSYKEINSLLQNKYGKPKSNNYKIEQVIFKPYKIPHPPVIGVSEQEYRETKQAYERKKRLQAEKDKFYEKVRKRLGDIKIYSARWVTGKTKITHVYKARTKGDTRLHHIIYQPNGEIDYRKENSKNEF